MAEMGSISARSETRRFDAHRPIASPARRHALKLLGGMALVLNGCADEPPAMRVAAHVWPGYELMFLAQREGWLDTRQVTLIDTRSATESMQALEAGEVDAAALTLDETLVLLDRGVALSVVLVFNISSGADVVVGKPGVNTLAQLAGKRIGAEDTAVGALMLHKLLSAAGVSRDEVQIVSLTIDQHLAAWQADEIDVLVSYEPVSGTLLRQGAHRLFDSSTIPDAIFDVLAVRSEVLQTRHGRRATETLISAHFRALWHLRRNPADASFRLALRMGNSGPEALESYRGLVLPDEFANLRLLAGQPDRMVLAATEIARILHQQGRLSSPQPGDFVDARFLPRPDSHP